MAATIFVSSTCYDFADLRSTLRRDLEHSGHSVILSEDHDATYAPDVHTQLSCVDAVTDATVVVAIIGGRLGSKMIDADVMKTRLAGAGRSIPSFDAFLGEHVPSATQAEQIQAHLSQIPVIACVRASVWAERNVFNRSGPPATGTVFPSIAKQDDAVQIFSFLNALQSLSRGNGIITFDTSAQLQAKILAQLSGLLAWSLPRASAVPVGEADGGTVVEAAATLSAALDARGWAHAFGGRLARASLGGSLSFTELDLTLYLNPHDHGEDVLRMVRDLGLDVGRVSADTIAASEQLRARWDGRSVDFFLGNEGYRADSLQRVVFEDVGGVRLPVLGLEDQLIIATATGNLYPELLTLAATRTIDEGYVEHWVQALVAS